MEIQPCPFCGELPELIEGTAHLVNMICHKNSSCKDTGLIICYLKKDEKQAIEQWNNRTKAK